MPRFSVTRTRSTWRSVPRGLSGLAVTSMAISYQLSPGPRPRRLESKRTLVTSAKTGSAGVCAPSRERPAPMTNIDRPTRRGVRSFIGVEDKTIGQGFPRGTLRHCTRGMKFFDAPPPKTMVPVLADKIPVLVLIQNAAAEHLRL